MTFFFLAFFFLGGGAGPLGSPPVRTRAWIWKKHNENNKKSLWNRQHPPCRGNTKTFLGGAASPASPLHYTKLSGAVWHTIVFKLSLFHYFWSQNWLIIILLFICFLISPPPLPHHIHSDKFTTICVCQILHFVEVY